jgi:2,4-dienoyl-CoA reductase (NADPH2)
VTGPVHEHDGKILMQILHAGRYAYHPFNVAPSAIRVSLKRTPLGLRRKADTQLFDAALTHAGANQQVQATGIVDV